MIKRVACAVSGGVDSAVSALLLKERGFDVVGVFMNNWDFVEEGESNCPRTKDEADAREICDNLGIPLHTVDFVKEYWNDVFENLLKGYERGRTVVADVDCNSLIKFEALHSFAISKLGADAIATGHYARNSLGDFLERSSTTLPARLLRAADPLKDQTYFLAKLTEIQLRRSMFPIGAMTKPQVKQKAVESGLSATAMRKESMGLCYVGKRKDFSEFLEKYIGSVPGDIVDEDSGEMIGSHEGVHRFTIGKRVTLPNSHSTHYGFFVSRLDPKNRRVYVCRGSHNPKLFSKEIRVETPHWINEAHYGKVEFLLQRHCPTIEGVLSTDHILTTRLPIRAAAPGQHCVFYQNDECLGTAEINASVVTLEPCVVDHEPQSTSPTSESSESSI